MNTYQVEESATINASAAQIYAILSDYRKGHPAILPKPYFTGLEVTEGGQGAGTAITVDLSVLGTKVTYYMTVTEPEPGRILQEEDKAAGVLTRFIIEPVNGGNQSHVTIKTTFNASPGLKGWLEKMMNRPVARRIYARELVQLEQVIQQGV